MILKKTAQQVVKFVGLSMAKADLPNSKICIIKKSTEQFDKFVILLHLSKTTITIGDFRKVIKKTA